MNDMQTFSFQVAKARFSQLIQAAARGEKILITRAETSVALLAPFTAPKRRGMLPGMTFNADASDALDAEIADLFEAKYRTK
jgi:antitoxin (DNA-binding transcriptional repressor) of toxin-antitoxin stability system